MFLRILALNFFCFSPRSLRLRGYNPLSPCVSVSLCYAFVLSFLKHNSRYFALFIRRDTHEEGKKCHTADP